MYLHEFLLNNVCILLFDHLNPIIGQIKDLLLSEVCFSVQGEF